MKDLIIAAVSLKSRPVEPEENLARHIPWIEKAKQAGADLCCFPEMSVTGFCPDYQLFFQASEPVDGPSTQKMVELARRHNIIIGFGMATRNANDLVGNSYILVGPQGYLGKYTKTHVPPFEYQIETGGGEFCVIDIGPAKIGVNTCFDNWFAESGRLSYLNGAEIILAPFWMSWGDHTIKTDPVQAFEDWKKLAMINFPAVAWQNGLFHVTINSCGGIDEKGIDYFGPPLVLYINPQGELEKQSGPAATGELMIVHKLEAQKLYDRRGEELFHPKYRRPEIYGNLSKLNRE